MRARLARRRPDLLALAALALLTLVFFWPVSLDLGWIPRGGGDLASFLWPTYSYAAQSLHGGRIPLWNHSLYSGAPFAADNQSGLFYPINLLTFLLAPDLPYRAMEWLVVFHVWLAGAGMYALVRVLLSEQSPIPNLKPAVASAVFSAIAFMFSDIFVTHVGNLNIIAVSAWLPIAFAAMRVAYTRRSAGWAAAAGLAAGAAALAGHAQMTLILLGALGLYAAWEVASGGRGQRAGGLKLAAVAFVAAMGVSAVAVLPAIEMTRFTGRARLDYASAAEYSLPWAGLAGLFSPLLFGRGAEAFWAPWARVELGYAGALPLVFAGLAPFRQRRVAVFLGLLAAFGLLAALGENTPVHRLLYLGVPGFAQLRVPARFVLLTDFSLAALAGLGLSRAAAGADGLAKRAGAWGGLLMAAALIIMLAGYSSAAGAGGGRHPQNLAWALAVGLGLLLAGTALAGLPRLRPWAPALAMGLLAADLVGQGAWVEVDRNDPTLGYQHPAAAEFLLSQPGPKRIDNASGRWAPDAAARLYRAGGEPHWGDLEDIGGISNPLALAAYQTYIGAVGSRGTPLYNFANAQFVIADKGRPPGDETFVPVFDQDPSVDIYLNTQAMPRASLVYSASVAADGAAAFGGLQAPGFDPAAETVVEGGPALAGQGGPSNLYYLDYAPESFSLVAVTSGPAYLVLSEVWYPGWRARLDGQETPIYRANLAFRAVYLPEAGEHVVEMRFDPWTWKAGLGMTVVTLMGLGLWGLSRRQSV